MYMYQSIGTLHAVVVVVGIPLGGDNYLITTRESNVLWQPNVTFDDKTKS